MKKDKKRKNAKPILSGKNVQNGSMYSRQENSRHPHSYNPNKADQEFAKMTRKGVGP